MYSIDNKKKIVFVINSLDYGGAEKIFISLLAALDKSVFDVEVVVLEGKDKAFIASRCNCPFTVLDKRKPIDFFRLVFSLGNLLKRKKPDLIVSFLTYSNYVVLLSRAIFNYKIRIVVAEHSVVSRCGVGVAGFIRKFLVKIAYPLADNIVVVSNGCKDELVSEFGVAEEKIKVIYNGIDIDALNRLSSNEVSHPWFKERIPIFVTVGRLTKAKNHQLLLRAFALLCRQGNYRLVIIGHGDEEIKLKELARVLGISDSVLFLGYQDNPYKFIVKSSVFVLSSSWESFSLAIVEAMSLGVPVVSTNCSFGPGEIIDNNRNGLLVPVSDVEAMAHAMSKMVSNNHLREEFIKNGLLKVQRFRLDNMIGRYVDLLNKELCG